MTSSFTRCLCCLQFTSHSRTMEQGLKTDTGFLLIVTCWELSPQPSSFLPCWWILALHWPGRLHFERGFMFPLPCFSWQVSDWSSLDMHKRGGEEEVWRPSDPAEPIQGCIPLHPLVTLLTQQELCCNSEERIALCHIRSWTSLHCDANLKETPNRHLLQLVDCQTNYSYELIISVV